MILFRKCWLIQFLLARRFSNSGAYTHTVYAHASFEPPIPSNRISPNVRCGISPTSPSPPASWAADATKTCRQIHLMQKIADETGNGQWEDLDRNQVVS